MPIINGAQGALGGVVVELEEAVLEIGTQALQMREGIADGAGQRRLRRETRQLGAQPALKLIEVGPGLCAAHRGSSLRGLAAHGVLDRVQRADALQRLGGDRRALCGMDVEELAPYMGQTSDLADRSGTDEALEPGVAIGVHPAAEVGQMTLGMTRLAVGGEPVPRRRRPGACR